VFTSSTTWTVPVGVTSVDVFCVGGGGGGAFSSNHTYSLGGNGHSGIVIIRY